MHMVQGCTCLSAPCGAGLWHAGGNKCPCHAIHPSIHVRPCPWCLNQPEHPHLGPTHTLDTLFKPSSLCTVGVLGPALSSLPVHLLVVFPAFPLGGVLFPLDGGGTCCCYGLACHPGMVGAGATHSWPQFVC